jgi:hypothetical protein
MPKAKKQVVEAVEEPKVTVKKATKSKKQEPIAEIKKSYKAPIVLTDTEDEQEYEEIEKNFEIEKDDETENSIKYYKSSVTSMTNSTPVFISNSSTSDSDRVKLAQAINNFTIKSEQLLQEMKNFETFRESILSLDILIGTKKQEFEEMTFNMESTYKNKTKRLENEHNDRTKQLESDFVDRAKKLESEHSDKRKNLTSEYQDMQVEMRRKVTEDKTRYCTTYATEMKMRFIREDELTEIFNREQKSLRDYEDLKKTFDKQCDAIRAEEIKKYSAQLKAESNTMELTHRANNAQLQAQVEQQKREILMLTQTIESLKAEIREQRELTREVAQASSKAQITQTIGKN